MTEKHSHQPLVKLINRYILCMYPPLDWIDIIMLALEFFVFINFISYYMAQQIKYICILPGICMQLCHFEYLVI